MVRVCAFLTDRLRPAYFLPSPGPARPPARVHKDDAYFSTAVGRESSGGESHMSEKLVCWGEGRGISAIWLACSGAPRASH